MPCFGTYMSEESKIKCDFINCFAGMGLAGGGRCFAYGAWWMNDCPNFKDEDEWLLEWKKLDTEMKAFEDSCPVCEAGRVKKIRITEDFVVKGFPIPVEYDCFKCEDCGVIHIDVEAGDDPFKKATQIYKQRYEEDE